MRQFCRVLADRSLVSAYLADRDAILLHDVFRGYLRHLLGDEWAAAHRSLIDAYRASAGNQWLDLGDEHGYLWRYLPYHLHQADYWYVAGGRVRVVLHDLRDGSPTDGATLTLDLGLTAEGTYDHRVGPEGDWMIDLHQRFDFQEAVEICRLMEPLRPFIAEDPLREEQFRTQIPKLRLLTSVPIAPGEERSRWA